MLLPVGGSDSQSPPSEKHSAFQMPLTTFPPAYRVPSAIQLHESAPIPVEVLHLTRLPAFAWQRRSHKAPAR
jgi:hypothetical protein